jgi:anaerobic magnesium-protoporphyrin IX monomethyl ester cyclase
VLRPPVESLDSLPFMARDFLDEKHGVVHMVTLRGCPFPCTYCAARAFQDLYLGDYNGRRRRAQKVVEELLEIRQKGPLNYVIFLDDTFTIHKEWVREFCRLYGREIAAGFSIHARVDTVDSEMLEDLAKAGCRHIVYGVESGSFRVRRDIMKRPVESARIIDVFQRTKQAGILVTANYMLGLPGETPEEIEETLALNEELEPNDFGYFVFYPYPGTCLFELCRAKGYLPENYLALPANNRQSILSLPGLTQADIEHYYERFTAAREQLYMNQYGGALDQSRRALVHADIAKNALQG